jgi:CRP-like cAMP-binding protein
MVRLKFDSDVINTIRANHIFSEMTEEELRTSLRHLEVTSYEPGEIIFQQGDFAPRFFVVCEGVVQLFRTSPMGDKKVIDIVKAGESFAEAVFFMGSNYPVHAMAVDHTKLAGIAFQDFNACLANNSNLAFRMMGSMSRRIHTLINEIDRLTLSTACQRLAFYLMEQAETGHSGSGTTIQLNAPKHVIASRIGVKPETLSRILSRLKEEGIVEESGHRLTVLDVGKLNTFRLEGIKHH